MGLQESKMTRLKMYRLKSLWGNHQFDFAISLACGFSGGIISLWDPFAFSKEHIWSDKNYVIVKGRWIREDVEVYMVNVYGPQQLHDKVNLWSKLSRFMVDNVGKYILFGDWNSVRSEEERFGTEFCSRDAEAFNEFIDSQLLFEVPLGGLQFTRRNKAGSKFSKLDRFFLSANVLDHFDNLKGIVLPRGFSDHSHVFLFQDIVDFGPTFFKIFDSWFARDDFDSTVRSAWADITANIGEEIKDLDVLIDMGSASPDIVNRRNSLFQDKGDLSKLEAMD
ncbi:uncharacterized protein [Rutidosis leptorrhynchoides]|uniref:uncharacterized protein n=1 Tax=Rutidosis leptorrhynchoides TaxID=125765 RepID=UPI003A99D558